jgi:hypothetical protein
MTTEAPERPQISDDEIRDWARSTGRKIGDRGRIPAAVRGEYEAIARDLGPEPGPAAPDAPPDADAAPAPPPARPEARPRAVPKGKRPRSRIAAFLAGDPKNSSNSKSTGRKSSSEKRTRTPVDKFAGKLWEWAASATEHFNVPVARCMAWQSPYVGLMAEETIRGTVVDKILQPIVRSEEKVTTLAAVIAMPIIVGALQNPANQPDAGLLGVARYQVLSRALEECVEAQLEAFGSGEMAAKVQQSTAEREERKAQVAAVLDMVWAVVPEPKTAEEAAQAEADELARRAAAARVAYGPVPPPGATVVPGQVIAEPDARGRAAEHAAAAMAAAGEAAAAQQRAAVATVSLGTARL